MKKYIVLMVGELGCDYSIGCGKKWEVINAIDRNDALTKVFGDPAKITVKDVDVSRGEWADENNIIVSELYEEGQPYEVSVYELAGDYISTMECSTFNEYLAKKFDTLKQEKKMKIDNKKEKALYEKLKKKYG
jgi:hypothetical protein